MMMNLLSTIVKVDLDGPRDARFKIIPFARLLHHMFIKINDTGDFAHNTLLDLTINQICLQCNKTKV